MNKTNNIEILDEIHKGAKMGMDSISFVSEKVGDAKFKDNLSYQYNLYGDILKQVNDIYTKYGDIPNDSDIMTKTMSWTGIQMNTMNDKSNSHIADMLIQGTTMGIIKGRELLNKNPNADKEIVNILNNFVTMQENNVEQLKTFL